MEAICDGGIEARERSLVKRRINREHNSNFRAGHVQLHEEQLHKTGIRGRKAACIYILTATLILLALSNSVLIWLILGALQMSHEGVESMEFIPEENLLRFKTDVEIAHLVAHTNTIGGRHDEDLELGAENNQEMTVRLGVRNRTRASMSVSSDSVSLFAREAVTFIDPESGEMFFNSQDIPFPKNVKHLISERINTNRITSGLNERLSVTSKVAELESAQNILIDSSAISIGSKYDLNLTAVRISQ